MFGWPRGLPVIIAGMNPEASNGLAPADWLLAETTRRIDEADGEFRLDDPATQSAAAAQGNIEQRIAQRARRLPGGDRTVTEIGQLLGASRWIIAVLMLLGLLTGAAAGSAVQTGANTIALSYALVVLLGVPLALLLVWAALNFRPRGTGTPGLPGRGLWWLLALVSRRFGLAAGRRHLAAALAELGHTQGRTLMALTTHAFWTMFFIGCIGWMWLRFLGLRFDFSWETTLLSGPWLEQLIPAIGWLPGWLFGLSLPDPEQVHDVLANRSDPGDRGLWATYLIGALTLYGLVPRALLALWFLHRWRHTRLPLDLARPGYLRLLPVMARASRTIGARGQPPPAHRGARGGPAAAPGSGDAVLVGVELDDRTPWPPDLPGGRVLGRADDRQQRKRIREALALLQPRPGKIIALCSLARSPDRGTMTWLCELARIAPVEIALADARRLPALGIDPHQREQDWRRLAQRFDLDLAQAALPGRDEPLE